MRFLKKVLGLGGSKPKNENEEKLTDALTLLNQQLRRLHVGKTNTMFCDVNLKEAPDTIRPIGVKKTDDDDQPKKGNTVLESAPRCMIGYLYFSGNHQQQIAHSLHGMLDAVFKKHGLKVSASYESKRDTVEQEMRREVPRRDKAVGLYIRADLNADKSSVEKPYEKKLEETIDAINELTELLKTNTALQQEYEIALRAALHGSKLTSDDKSPVTSTALVFDEKQQPHCEVIIRRPNDDVKKHFAELGTFLPVKNPHNPGREDLFVIPVGERAKPGLQSSEAFITAFTNAQGALFAEREKNAADALKERLRVEALNRESGKKR